MSKKRVLWFIRGAATQEQIKLAKDNGFLIRNAAIDTSNGFIERCDAVCGDIPDAYSGEEAVEAPVLVPEKKASTDISKLSKDALMAQLTERGIEFDASLVKKDLVALLTDAMEKEAEQNGSDNP